MAWWHWVVYALGVAVVFVVASWVESRGARGRGDDVTWMEWRSEQEETRWERRGTDG